jgi:hypothetical protein
MSADGMEELRRLKRIYQEGLIDEITFERRQQRLLDVLFPHSSGGGSSSSAQPASGGHYKVDERRHDDVRSDGVRGDVRSDVVRRDDVRRDVARRDYVRRDDVIRNDVRRDDVRRDERRSDAEQIDPILPPSPAFMSTRSSQTTSAPSSRTHEVSLNRTRPAAAVATYQPPPSQTPNFVINVKKTGMRVLNEKIPEVPPPSHSLKRKSAMELYAPPPKQDNNSSLPPHKIRIKVANGEKRVESVPTTSNPRLHVQNIRANSPTFVVRLPKDI